MNDVTLEAAGVRVVFHRLGDRIAHRVETFDAAGQRWAAVLESAEGTADEAWPASPAFQQMHVEQRASGPVVLLVGMAGRSHWSAAVEAVDDGAAILFDVAVRVRQVPERLGSAYRPTTPEAATGAPAVAIEGCLSPELPTAAPATLSWTYRLRCHVAS